MTATAEVTTTGPTPTPSKHGSVYCYTSATTPSAATRLLQDANAFIAQCQSTTEPDVSVGAIATAIGVGTQIVGGIFQAGMLATSIAGTAQTYQNPAPIAPDDNDQIVSQQGELSITFTNNSSVPLAFNGVKSTTDILVTKSVSALTTGQSDTMMLTSPSAISGSTAFSLAFNIGSGAKISDGYATIPVSLLFNYAASAKVWTSQVNVDGMSADSPLTSDIVLCSCSFIPSIGYEPEFSAFSLYMTPAQTANAALHITFYDTTLQ